MIQQAISNSMCNSQTLDKEPAVSKGSRNIYSPIIHRYVGKKRTCVGDAAHTRGCISWFTWANGGRGDALLPLLHIRTGLPPLSGVIVPTSFLLPTSAYFQLQSVTEHGEATLPWLQSTAQPASKLRHSKIQG